MSNRFESVMTRSYQLAAARHHELVTLEHLLAALLEDKDLQQLIVRTHGDLDALTTDTLSWLDNPANHVVVKVSQYQPRHTTLLANVVKKSKTQSMFSGKQEVSPLDILLAMYEISDSPAAYFLDKHTSGHDSLVEYVGRAGQAEQEDMDAREAEEILRTYLSLIHI